VERELLHPVLALPATEAGTVAEVFGDRVVGWQLPRLLQLDNLVDMLLAPPRAGEPDEPEAEDAGESEGVDLQSYPPAVIAEATRVLRRAEERPVALSELLREIEGDAQAAELVLLSALWAYAPDVAEPDEQHKTNLTAEHAGRGIDHRLVWGDELLVTFSEEEREA
jgi:hypothetical protein